MNKAEIMTKRHDKKCPQAPRLRFPEFRDEWHSQALGAIASIIKEKVGNKKCTLMSIMTGVGLIPQIDKFGKEIAGDQYKNYIIIRNNDFAYNKSATKGYPQGFIALYTGSEIAAVPNSIFTCFKIQPESIVPAYLNYLFLGNFHGKWLQRYITVGARAHGSLSIDDDDLLSLPIPYPKGVSSLGEQQRIADCLSSLDERIAAETNKLDALKDHKKGLLKQLFPAEGEALPRLRFFKFRNTGEWKERPLVSVANYENGKAYEPHIVENGRYIVVNSRFISTDGTIKKYSNVPICIAKRGDILMVLSDLPNGRALAKTYYVNADDLYAVNQRVCCLTPHSANGKFLCFLLNRHPNLLIFDDGKNQTHLKKDSVLQCLIKLPLSFDEQQRIADCLSSLDELITSQTKKIDLLKEHKKGLMQQLFPRIDKVLA